MQQNAELQKKRIEIVITGHQHCPDKSKFSCPLPWQLELSEESISR